LKKSGSTEKVELEAYKKSAIKAAVEAGDLLVKMQSEKREIKYKGDIDLVTDADSSSEKLIIEIINGDFAEHSIIAEEESPIKGDSAFEWLIDPLDGTTNYSHNFPFYCVSIALRYNGKIVLGVIYAPLSEELFTAELLGGAFLNGKRISVSRENNLGRSLLATGFPYDIRETDRDNLNYFKAFAKKAQGIRRAGSAALDLAYLSCGRLDGFWEMKLKPWDIAAGSLLVKEAGGKISDFYGGPLNLSKGDIVASNSLIHSQLLETINKVDLGKS